MPISPTLEASQSEREDPEKGEEESMKEGSEKDEEQDLKAGEGLSQDGETVEEEGRKAVGRKGPKMPTKMEQEEHARTH